MMGRLTLLVATAVLALGLAAPVAAHPDLPVVPASDPAFTATDNVEHLGRFAQHTGTAGGRLVGDRFYLTDPRGVHVYDVTTPEEPRLEGSLALPQTDEVNPALAQEEPDTDGEILLVDGFDPADPAVQPRLQVVDVSDPGAMEVLGSAPVTDHTWTCVSTPDNGCAYAYGRRGYIVDLTDPTDPQVLDTSWREHVGLSEGFGNTPYSHDLTEFRTGRVMNAGAVNVLMDTTDPAEPRPLVDLEVDYHQFGYHGVEWANGGRDSFLVAGTEIAPEGPTNLAGSDCQGEGSWIRTYDTSSVARADERSDRGGRARGLWDRAAFEPIDEFHVEDRGIFLDGNAPAHTLYCAHWFDLHPDFEDGGTMAVAYYDWGTRFVEVDETGHMEETGWFVPVDGYTGSTTWITDDIVYVMDYRRGLDVLRLSDEPATGTVAGGVEAATGLAALGAALGVTPPTLPMPPGSAAALAVGLVLGAAGLARRRRAVPDGAV
jgi:hypothetical protein